MTTPDLLIRSAELVLTYASGAEAAPGDPFGRNILTLRGDGSLDLENRWYTRRRNFQGRVALEVLDRVLAALRAGKFPETPPHRIPPGSSLRTVHVKNGTLEGYTLPIEWHAGAKMPGLGDAFKLLDSIVRQASVDEIRATADFVPGLVEGAVKLSDTVVPSTT